MRHSGVRTCEPKRAVLAEGHKSHACLPILCTTSTTRCSSSCSRQLTHVRGVVTNRKVLFGQQMMAVPLIYMSEPNAAMNEAASQERGAASCSSHGSCEWQIIANTQSAAEGQPWSFPIPASSGVSISDRRLQQCRAHQGGGGLGSKVQKIIVQLGVWQIGILRRFCHCVPHRLLLSCLLRMYLPLTYSICRSLPLGWMLPSDVSNMLQIPLYFLLLRLHILLHWRSAGISSANFRSWAWVMSRSCMIRLRAHSGLTRWSCLLQPCSNPGLMAWMVYRSCMISLQLRCSSIWWSCLIKLMLRDEMPSKEAAGKLF